MATLSNKQNSQEIICRVNNTIGRDRETNVTFLTNPSASRNHAITVWDGEQWQIKDISLNGTYINAFRMPRGQYKPLNLTDKIQFGGLDEITWEVINLTPPITGLIPINHESSFIPLFDIVILPLEGPEIMVYLSEQSQWICKADGKNRILTMGDIVGNTQQRWQFVEGRPTTATSVSNFTPPLNDIKFHFSASRNEEHVSLNLTIENKDIDMGERNHHYLLLLLARQRLNDTQRGLHPTEQGWMDKGNLIQMSGIKEQHINIQICRFRKQVVNLTHRSNTLHQIIERRPGELRFAYSDISIEGGCSIARNI
ncbi:MAG: hypothetical protein ACI9C4_002636 [Paraglaciecola sp.]|jgi:hypothetical protein